MGLNLLYNFLLLLRACDNYIYFVLSIYIILTFLFYLFLFYLFILFIYLLILVT